MATIYIRFFDKRIKEEKTVRMIEDGGLFKYRLWNITILYDDRDHTSKFKWGYQTSECVRHFFDEFELMKGVVNMSAVRLGLAFEIESYVIRECD